MDSKTAQLTVRESGLEPALPFLILDAQSCIVFINARMKEMLSPSGAGGSPKDVSELERVWPFFNEFQGAPAFLGTIAKAKNSKQPQLFYAEAYLKTFRVHVAFHKNLRIVVAELVRSGDLLEDVEARQVLFRSLSHEIRTSVMALMGYTQMVGDKAPEARTELEGMRNALGRLENVVRRLDDFKSELKVLQEEGKAPTKSAAPKGAKGSKK
ncbi:MAG: histidine kinase dimerization/phospho-acceptor domain-containing protein [Bdellovibrionota bacterium]